MYIQHLLADRDPVSVKNGRATQETAPLWPRIFTQWFSRRVCNSVVVSLVNSEVNSDRVTVRKTRDTYIRRRRVPLAEVCCSISQNFRIVYANEIGQSSVEVVLVRCGGVGVGGVATLPAAVARKIGRASNEKVKCTRCSLTDSHSMIIRTVAVGSGRGYCFTTDTDRYEVWGTAYS